MTENINSWNMEDYRLSGVCSIDNGKLGGLVALRPPEELLRENLALPDVALGLFPPQLKAYQGMVGRWDDLGDDGSVAVWFEEANAGEIFPADALRHLIGKDSKYEFNAEIFLEVLQHISSMSDDQIATSLSNQMKDFLQGEPTPVEVWNFYKKVLDLAVNSGGASSFVLTTMNLEAFYQPPEGDVYLQSDGSIHDAPWRQ